MTLTKDSIIDSVQKKAGIPRQKSKELVETLFEIIKTNLEKKDAILISGFGKFSVKDKATRRGRNPATGKDMILNKRRVVTFKCSSVLKNKLSAN
jgi:integration host factor subunit alpha